MSPAEHETPYQETNALIAVMGDDHAGANEILTEMSPTELDRLTDQAQTLADLAYQMRRTKLREEAQTQ